MKPQYPFDDLVVFREYTEDYKENYDTKINKNDPYYNMSKYDDLFCEELDKFYTVLLNSDENFYPIGFWRLTSGPQLKRIIHFLNGKCSCGHQGNNWCPHEHLYKFIEYYMNSNGIFLHSINITIMKFLAY